MKEFIEKLIGRLEEYKDSHLIEHDSEECLHCQENEDDWCNCRDCSICVWDKAVEIVNQLAEECNNESVKGDLISRSALLNAFNNTGIQITFDLPVEEILGDDVDIDNFTMLVQDAIQVYKKMVIDTIKNQPTAFDTEKVVEQLLDMRLIRVEQCHGDYEIEVMTESNFDDAIAIVKKGGVE